MKKIFGIGLSRTGTTSLAETLKQFGINIVHYPSEDALYSVHNDGACDIPAAAHFVELDKKFPNSKFIYTVRDKDDWLHSMERYLERKKERVIGGWMRENRIKIYGQLEFDKDIFSKKYDEHNKKIREYFKSRKGDLLILNICTGKDMEHLFKFIGIDNPHMKRFPHANKRSW